MVKCDFKDLNKFIEQKPNLWAVIVLVSSVFFMLITVITVAVSSNHDDDWTYEYIVVGDNTEGALMAYRLSNSAHDRVLLIVAGYDVDEDIRINTSTPNTLNLEKEYFDQYFWQYRQARPEVVPWNVTRDYTTGRVLGGDSSVNNMIYTRGSSYMNERWQIMTGDGIWSPENALQNYISMETYYGTGYDVNRRGTSGLFAITEEFTSGAQNTPTTMAQKFVTAIQQMIFNAYPVLSDYNDFSEPVWWGSFTGWQLHNKPTGGRTSTSNSFLGEAVRRRKNLDVMTESLATRIVLDPRNRASGVEFIHKSKLYKASANKEVILCAGPFSPVLMQASGIGNATTLRAAGIEPRAENPSVGQNMTAQLFVEVLFNRNPIDLPSANRGDLFEGGAFLPNPIINDPFDDINTSPRKYMLYANALNTSLFNVRLVDLYPNAKGSITPVSTDIFRVMTSTDHIFDGPLGQHDLDVMVEAFTTYICGIAKEYAGTGNGPPVDPTYVMVSPPYSICSNTTTLREWIVEHVRVHERQRTGGAAMGASDSDGSVVNSKGTVWGVSGLRVADSSIIPFGVDGTRVGPGMLVAYTIATQILLGLH